MIFQLNLKVFSMILNKLLIEISIGADLPHYCRLVKFLRPAPLTKEPFFALCQLT